VLTAPAVCAGMHGVYRPGMEVLSSVRRFEGITAVVTGGASGIGKAVTVGLAAAGPAVFVGSRSREQEATWSPSSLRRDIRSRSCRRTSPMTNRSRRSRSG
jgi:hypothetical protein